jgi:hypothetical protein
MAYPNGSPISHSRRSAKGLSAANYMGDAEVFEGLDEKLGLGVVVGVAHPTHAGLHPVIGEQLSGLETEKPTNEEGDEL